MAQHPKLPRIPSIKEMEAERGRKNPVKPQGTVSREGVVTFRAPTLKKPGR
jgi:hypothetical protein